MMPEWITQLLAGDEVYWTDPDDDLCSRYYIIDSITIVGSTICITGKDGSYLECYAHELS